MAHEEEILGKAYDSRLMRRLLTYLRPYRCQVAVALASIIFKSCCDVLGPYLVKVAVDRYLAPIKGAGSELVELAKPPASAWDRTDFRDLFQLAGFRLCIRLPEDLLRAMGWTEDHV